MADGCNLYCTGKDLQDAKSSIAKGKISNDSQTASNMLNVFLKKDLDGFVSIIENRRDLRHEVMKQLIINSFGKGRIANSDEMKLPHALKEILKFNLSIDGVFSNSSKISKHSGNGTRHPYDVLLAAAIAKQRKITSKSGKEFTLYSEDKIGFGRKSESHNLLGSNRATIQSDLLISRGDKNMAPTGIEAKYTKDVCKLSEDTEVQLKEIRNSIIKGQMRDFYFMSNGVFSPEFLGRVSNYNVDLAQNWVDKNRSSHNFVDTSKEFIEKNYLQIAKDYHVPQINLCEMISFDN